MWGKLTNEQCPKCKAKNVFRYAYDTLSGPTDDDLEEGKIILGIEYSYLQCQSCQWKGELDRAKIYN